MANRTYNKIYSDFLGGISYYDKNAPRNTYYEGREIDPHRGLGYLMPGIGLTCVTKSDDTPQIIDQSIVDICVDITTNDCYFIGQTNKLYHMNNLSTETWNSDFDGASHYYKTITGSTRGESLFIYPTKIGAAAAVNKLFYIYQDDFGMYDLSSTFDDDWGSTVPTGAGALQDAPHYTIEWKSIRWITNGRYVAKFDGQTGDNGTLELTKLDLGQNWEATALFSTKDFIGVCAWQKHASGDAYRTESRIFMWDGTSTTYSYSIPVRDNKILEVFNHNGRIYVWTTGRDFGTILSYLTDNGLRRIRKLKTSVDGVFTGMDKFYKNTIDAYRNRIIFGANFLVFSYGAEEEGHPMAFTVPWGYAKGGDSRIYTLKTVLNNKVFISYYDGTKHYLLDAVGGNSVRATYRGNYTDLGQSVRINYVKFYFKPLESGDDITVSMDTNYGTANSLGTIKYSTDGAVSSKIFRKPLECHTFRPCISWTAGGVAISKIVVNYQFISD